MSYALEQFKQALKPCPRCGGREWMIERYLWSNVRSAVFVECCACRFWASAHRPGELARDLKQGVGWGPCGRSVPRSYRHTYSIKPMRAAERRFTTKLKDDPEATEVESKLSRRDKSFLLWNYW